MGKSALRATFDRVANDLSCYLITRLDEIHGLQSGHVLTYTEQSGGTRYDRGWSAVLPESQAKVHILLPVTYPEALIDIYATDKCLAGQLPNVGHDLKLCLNSPGLQHHPSGHCELSWHRLMRADTLLLKRPEAVDDCDWQDEIQSYWTLTAGELAITTLIEARGPSRELAAVVTNTHVYVADCHADLQCWLQNRDNVDTSAAIRPGALLWFSQPLRKSQFPRNYTELRELAIIAQGDQILDRIPRGHTDQTAVLIGFEQKNNSILLGLILQPHQISSFKGKTQPINRASREYRQEGQVPRVLSRSRIFRADPPWIHFRGGRSEHRSLTNKHVLLLGCGSLGSGIADVLAKSGVGQFTLIDPDVLSHDNVARHLLGSQEVGQNKALALAINIQRHLPHIRCTAIPETWNAIAEQLGDFDLIVSTMAVWQSNVMINRLTLRNHVSPIIYSWLEPNGIAAHAVAIVNRDSCLECGLTSSGWVAGERRATEWPTATEIHLPGCSVSFQPYGAVDVMPAQQLTAELALEVLDRSINSNIQRTWLGSTKRLNMLGGKWNSDWELRNGPVGTGQRIVESCWIGNSSCSACNQG